LAQVILGAQSLVSRTEVMSTVSTPATMDELLHSKTPQTSWWMQRNDDGTPVQGPMKLAMLAVTSVLAMPFVASLLLLLPAATPLLALAPIVVVMSLPWWLHLPLTGKPLIIPLALVLMPVVALMAICSLSVLPMLLIVLVPFFSLLPFVLLLSLPLLFFVCTCVSLPILGYSVVPAWLSINWTWPLADGSELLKQIRGGVQQVFGSLHHKEQ